MNVPAALFPRNLLLARGLSRLFAESVYEGIVCLTHATLFSFFLLTTLHPRYASVFSHYKPVSRWPYTQQDVWLAVPSEWSEGPITHSGSGRWAGAFLTHDAMEVCEKKRARAPGFALWELSICVRA